MTRLELTVLFVTTTEPASTPPPIPCMELFVVTTDRVEVRAKFLDDRRPVQGEAPRGRAVNPTAVDAIEVGCGV